MIFGFPLFGVSISSSNITAKLTSPKLEVLHHYNKVLHNSHVFEDSIKNKF